VTGGNVSLYNERVGDDGNPQPIYPTPVIGMVGRVPDIRQVVGSAWRGAGDRIYLLGLAAGAQSEGLTLGASEYLATLHKTVAGMPPIVDFDLERRVQAVCREGIAQGWVRSAHDSAEGGLAVAIAESCIGANHGASIQLETTAAQRLDNLLFAEGGARIVVSVAADQVAGWEAHLQAQLPNAWQAIGTIGQPGSNFTVIANGETLIDAPIADLVDAWANAIDRRLAV
jgi:phosphoribosylformylglycinamidine synthase subunit PurL